MGVGVGVGVGVGGAWGLGEARRLLEGYGKGDADHTELYRALTGDDAGRDDGG